jgi:hypothetical protein
MVEPVLTMIKNNKISSREYDKGDNHGYSNQVERPEYYYNGDQRGQ